MKKYINGKSVLTFLILLGVVNLFADMTYEGASSINGQFLATLGASATAIGIISGIGEFLGYSLRFISGYISDKTGKYWVMTFIGYGINLFAVPALALAGNWQMAAFLVIAERVGRAIRKPNVEAMLSYTTKTYGRGWVYAFNNALDQTGGVLGPLIMAGVLFFKGDFRMGYSLLLVSALAALITLSVASYFFRIPEKLEAGPSRLQDKFTPSFFLYMLAGGCVAAGLVSFELISFHFAKTKVVTNEWIPLFFALAMGIDGISGLIFGKLYDKKGIKTAVIAFAISAFFAPLIFFGNFTGAFLGIILWGIGFGAQDTLLKSIIAGVLPEGKRSLAFGLFYTGYGFGWLIGSTISGLLYSHNLLQMVIFSMAIQIISLPIFVIADKYKN